MVIVALKIFNLLIFKFKLLLIVSNLQPQILAFVHDFSLFRLNQPYLCLLFNLLMRHLLDELVLDLHLLPDLSDFDLLLNPELLFDLPSDPCLRRGHLRGALVIERTDHSLVHPLHVGLSLLALLQLHRENVAPLSEESDLLLILDFLPSRLLPGLLDRLLHVLAPLTRQNTRQRLMRERQIVGGRSQVGQVAWHEGRGLGHVQDLVLLVRCRRKTSMLLAAVRGRRLERLLIIGHHF